MHKRPRRKEHQYLRGSVESVRSFEHDGTQKIEHLGNLNSKYSTHVKAKQTTHSLS